MNGATAFPIGVAFAEERAAAYSIRPASVSRLDRFGRVGNVVRLRARRRGEGEAASDGAPAVESTPTVRVATEIVERWMIVGAAAGVAIGALLGLLWAIFADAPFSVLGRVFLPVMLLGVVGAVIGKRAVLSWSSLAAHVVGRPVASAEERRDPRAAA